MAGLQKQPSRPLSYNGFVDSLYQSNANLGPSTSRYGVGSEAGAAPSDSPRTDSSLFGVYRSIPVLVRTNEQPAHRPRASRQRSLPVASKRPCCGLLPAEARNALKQAGRLQRRGPLNL
mgnify:CR=1 FL=1